MYLLTLLNTDEIKIILTLRFTVTILTLTLKVCVYRYRVLGPYLITLTEFKRISNVIARIPWTEQNGCKNV